MVLIIVFVSEASIMIFTHLLDLVREQILFALLDSILNLIVRSLLLNSNLALVNLVDLI